MGDRKTRQGQDDNKPVIDSYGRLSRVPETGEWEKVETQHEDNRRRIAQVGGVLGVELSDGLSGWKKNVRRPGWERLLGRVQSGESDGIVVWHTDRLFRQPADLETLIDLADRGFVVISAHGTQDVSNPDDRFILRIETAHAARSSDDTQRRIKRRFARMREQGIKRNGARAFGFPGGDRTWTPSGDPGEQRPQVSAELVKRERAALRNAAERVLAGASLDSITREWNDAGLRTATGNRWTPVTVRQVLKRASNAGLIEHQGEIVTTTDEADLIMSRDTLLRIRAKMTGTRRGRPPDRVYVGSRILICGRCGMPLNGRPQAHRTPYPDGEPRRQYWCNPQRGGCGRLCADLRWVDAEIRAFVVARLSDARHAEAVTAARAQAADRLAVIVAEIEQCEQLQESLSERLGRRELTPKAFDAANAPLVADLERLRTEYEELSGGNPQGPDTAQAPEVIAESWDTGPIDQRRSLFRTALGTAQMIIHPAQKGRGFAPDRIEVRERTLPH